MFPEHLLLYIIRPTLEYMGEKYHSPAAEQLLMATAAQETLCGRYLHQIKGPALGIYQMEPATIEDLHRHFINGSINLHFTLVEFRTSAGHQSESNILDVVGNLYYATALARAMYFRFAQPLPEVNDLMGIWKYYKRYWNTNKGAATEEEFLRNWHNMIGPLMPHWN